MTDTDIAVEMTNMTLKQLYQTFKSQVFMSKDEEDLELLDDVENGTQGKIKLNIWDMIEEEDSTLQTNDKFVHLDRPNHQAILGTKSLNIDEYRIEKDRRFSMCMSYLLDRLPGGNPWGEAEVGDEVQ